LGVAAGRRRRGSARSVGFERGKYNPGVEKTRFPNFATRKPLIFLKTAKNKFGKFGKNLEDAER
jgi:hypothetical protein